MNPANSGDREDLFLTPDHHMLLQIRDTLYEGSWADFIRDLRARAEGQPHVFETIPDTPGLKATIAHHLALIEQMRTWENRHQRTLRPGSDL